MLELNFQPFPVLETNRLVLRKIVLEDAENLFVLRTDEEVMKYIGRPRPKSIIEVEELIDKMNDITMRIQWGITLKDDNRIIGTIGYHQIEKEHYRAELGYMLHPKQWNNGIMTEAIQSIIKFGFNKMKLHSIQAIINPENDASRKILKKFNFLKEGYFKENFYFEGKFYDSEVYSLLNTDE